MIIDDIRADSRTFARWSTAHMFSRERFAKEMEDYIYMLKAGGKVVSVDQYGWDFDNQYYVMFNPSDDTETQYLVMFFLRVPLLDEDITTDAYDRAMKGI